MHKTEKRAKESRMNLMYSYLCDRTLARETSKPEKQDLRREWAGGVIPARPITARTE